MQRDDRSLIFRACLFAFGLFVLVLGLVLLYPTPPLSTGPGRFTTIGLMLSYVLVFGPLVFGDTISGLTGGRMVFYGFYALAVRAYAALLLVLVVLVNFPNPPIKLYSVIALVGAFVLLMRLFFGGSANSQIDRVEVQRRTTLAGVTQLRSKADMLAAVAPASYQRLGAPVDQLWDLLERIADELRHMSPVDSPEASAIEGRIAYQLDSLSNLVVPGVEPADQQLQEAINLAQGTLGLIAQRKTIRN